MASGSYRPQSPDLSSLHANNNNNNLSGYRPQSPDLSTLATPAYSNDQYQQPYRQILSAEYSNRFGGPAPQYQQATSAPFQVPAQQPFGQPFPQQYDMPSLRVKQEKAFPKQNGQNAGKSEGTDPTHGVVLKTSFPVARIKRIMQADEDIGKVAQVTPHVVSRALELFMIKLITASSEQARGPGGANSKGPRRVLAQHMKRAIQADDTFDFLADIVSKVPDAPTKSKKEVNSDSEDAKPKKRAKKRKDSTDDV